MLAGCFSSATASPDGGSCATQEHRGASCLLPVWTCQRGSGWPSALLSRFTYLLIMVDRTTRWPEAVPLTSLASVEMTWAFISTLVARFGTPSDISSDRGAQFTSELWSAVAQSLGVKLHHTTAYHPQANGLCERFHRSMKASLRGSLKESNWVDKLPWVLLGIRTAPKEDLQSSSAELVYGQPLRVPGGFVPGTNVPWSATLQRSTLLDNARLFAPVPTSRHGLPQSHIPAGLRTAAYVFIRHDAHRGPLRPPYEGPFRVLETGDKHFVVDMGGRPERLPIDRLKRAHLDVARPMELAQPPRRGRLPALPLPPAPLPPGTPTLHAPYPCHGGTPAAVVAPRPPVRHSRCGRLIRIHIRDLEI